MKVNKELKDKAEGLAQQLLFINSRSITPGDPDDREPVFAYVHGDFYRGSLEGAAYLLEELAQMMEV